MVSRVIAVPVVGRSNRSGQTLFFFYKIPKQFQNITII